MSATTSRILADKNIQRIKLDDILLDPSNPRFGNGDFTNTTPQPDVLNFIVSNFGVDDVLSSLSVNGYFTAEPLVCMKEGSRYKVLEGNRRVAAMLILASDKRASAHSERSEKYQKLYKEHGSPSFNPVPALVFDEGDDYKSLLSYLGVRHIVSTKDWDSFAKANWVNRTVDGNTLSIEDVSLMTGDSHQTIKKLLQGYNFISQLERENYFFPKNSNKGGRGSNPYYPFSWVYTLLGYREVKNFLEISDDPTNKSPIPEKSLENASVIVNAMFGDKSKGKDSQVGDSRNLTDLARAVASMEKFRYLKEGKHVKEIDDLTKPTSERLTSILFTIRDLLEEGIGRVSRDDLDKSDIPSLIEYLEQLKKLFKTIDNQIKDQLTKDKGNDDW